MWIFIGLCHIGTPAWHLFKLPGKQMFSIKHADHINNAGTGSNIVSEGRVRTLPKPKFSDTFEAG